MPKKSQSKSHYLLLKQKWLKRHKLASKNLQQKHKEAFDWIVEKFPAKEQLASSLIGAVMLSSVIPTSTVLAALSDKSSPTSEVTTVDKTGEMLGELKSVIGDSMRPLTRDEEVTTSQILSKYFGMRVNFEINGLRLNRSYGVIGAEQHLARFPGDNMATHLDMGSAEGKMFYASGMAPGRGAWGYFAESKAEFGEPALEREKWYIAVQTFEAPNYNGRLAEYRDFFKYRKMLVVNPQSGHAVVCDIADSGPAIWTGKHLGGSPEVMYFLGLGEKVRQGPVLYFFIDDPDNKVALGPVRAQ